MLGHILMTAVNAVFPILLVIALGQLLRRLGLMNESFMKMGNQLVFKFCLPCMLFINIYNIEGIGSIRWDIVLYCVAMICVVFSAAADFMPAGFLRIPRQRKLM